MRANRHEYLLSARGGARPDKIGNRRDDFGPLDYYALDSAGGFVYWHQRSRLELSVSHRVRHSVVDPGVPPSASA